MTVRIPAPIRSAGRLVLSRDARRNLLHEWRRGRSGEPPLPAAPVRSVLVLCHGNICRSPFAEALLARLRPDLEIRSAGLAAAEDGPADATAARVAKGFGVDLSHHRSRPAAPALLRAADIVLVMEAPQAAAVGERAPDVAARTFLLGDFLAHGPFRLLDPYGKPDAVFEAVFVRVSAAAERLAERIGKAPR
jgi:protein-tyrosine phosphatase